jgi:D-tyrosyl-tRNA(Tyr) deacylase
MTPDFRIELSHFPDRTLAWEWVTYNPQNVETILHCGGTHYATSADALKAAEAYMANRVANDRWQ